MSCSTRQSYRNNCCCSKVIRHKTCGMRDSVCNVLTISTLITSCTRQVVDILLCTSCNLIHSAYSLYRVITHSCLTRKHDCGCAIVYCVCYVSSFRTCWPWVMNHRIKHLGRCDNELTLRIGLLNDHLLKGRNLFHRDLNTHVSTSYHDTISSLDNRIDVINTLIILNLSKDTDIISAVLMKKLADLIDICCSTSEGCSDEIESLLHTEDQIRTILRGDVRHRQIYIRYIHTLFVRDVSTILNDTVDIWAINALNLKLNQTII